MHVVLMVEDHPQNRKLLRDILEIRFEVKEAASAEDAWPILEEGGIALILMDLQLPGMDGLTMIREINKKPEMSEIPIIAISAHAMQSTIDEVLAEGCVEYITKPITENPFQLVERFEKHIQKS